jgi:hypothetical protein
MLLLPWVLMYGISTILLNHGPGVRELFPSMEPVWETVLETEYQLNVTINTGNIRDIAKQILEDNNLHADAFGANGNSTRVNINIPDFLAPKRVFYFADENRLVVEQHNSIWREVLSRLHFRTGYGQGAWLNKVWGFTVDVVCLALILWIVTGIYLWWQLRPTRFWGIVAITSGVVSFLGLLFTV